MTGASWIHHYGSMTQSALKQERGIARNAGLGDRRNYRLLNQSWLARKLKKLSRLRQLKTWRDQELAAYGMSMHGLREHGRFVWIRCALRRQRSPMARGIADSARGESGVERLCAVAIRA
jgi:hypothetical protein